MEEFIFGRCSLLLSLYKVCKSKCKHVSMLGKKSSLYSQTGSLIVAASISKQALSFRVSREIEGFSFVVVWVALLSLSLSP
jgi:hypothetical protein